MENEFGNRLRYALTKKGITASELSRLSGVGKSDISYYMSGRYVPKQDKCYLLANALDVDPGWLMTGVEQKREESKPVVIPDTETFKKIMMSLSVKDYHTVMEIFTRAEADLKAKGEL